MPLKPSMNHPFPRTQRAWPDGNPFAVPRHLGTFRSRRNRWASRLAWTRDSLACALAFGLIALMALVL